MRGPEHLGRRLGRAWDRAGRRAAAFPAVAAEVLADAGDTVDVTALVRGLYHGGRRRGALPAQSSLTEAFGEPPLTLYRERDFYLELLFWHTGTTGVHEHRFSGAFLVAEGSSLETRYHFTEARALGGGLALGELTFLGAEVLPPGEVREIHPGGRRLIHSVFHLGAPSVTLVARTPARRGVEREYRFPHVALDPSARDPRTTKQLQLLNLMARTAWGDYVGAVCAGIAAGDVVEGFHLMSRARLHLSRARFAPVAAAMRRRHGALAAPLVEVADEDRRKWHLVHLRQTLTSADARFFLGVLINVPDRAGVLAALARRFPGQDPAACLAGFQRALAPLVRGDARELYAPLTRRAGVRA